MPAARFAEILRLLAAHDVEFVVVGMTAGILHGAPVTTIDLEVVHRRSRENVTRLLRALAELDAARLIRARKALRRVTAWAAGGPEPRSPGAGAFR
jgi:hypothetical protein